MPIREGREVYAGLNPPPVDEAQKGDKRPCSGLIKRSKQITRGGNCIERDTVAYWMLDDEWFTGSRIWGI